MTSKITFLLGLSAAATVGAQTVNIDNFLSGPRVAQMPVPGSYTFVQTGPVDSMIGGTRTVDVDNGALSLLVISTGGFRFQENRQYSDNGPLPQTTFSISYGSEAAPLGLDLSNGESLTIRFAEVTPGTPAFSDPNFGFQWIITSGPGEVSVSPIQGFQYPPFGMPGDFPFLLSEFNAASGQSPADFGAIQSIELAVSYPDAYAESPLHPGPVNRLRILQLFATTQVPETAANSSTLLLGFGLALIRTRRNR